MKRQFIFQTFITLLLLAGPAFAAWDISIIDSTGNTQRDPSIALDSAGYPHITYRRYNGLKYAYAYCGYTLAGDLDDNCGVDFKDFAVMAIDWDDDFSDLAPMATNWLIDCDQTPENPACVPK